ncbi:sensor histidine kinase [Aestuariivirga sp.]|uniref:sensor histidine kinase n=1 Tax=Aestuariivirga sp. TaxID=2650926 RepID=UPI003593C913
MTDTLSTHVESASTLAVIASSNEPLLFLTDDLRLIAASASFCRVYNIAPASVPGRPLSEIGHGEWGIPQIASLLKATAGGLAKVEMYETDLIRREQETRHLVLNATRLEDGDAEHTRLLLAITDVTAIRAEAKLKADLIREKEILLLEVQHRVANSLQIIASILMRSARQVQSTEARGHLHNAHHRVLSIAAVQRQLAQSSLNDVDVAPYFHQLCESLGTSMISDPTQIKIVVRADHALVPPGVSVSLGLIVTELVINALKHAFQEKASGQIHVSYHRHDTGWTLSVEDTGSGMPSGPNAKPGLGTGIVEALATQLDAAVEVTDNSPGTAVTLVHVATKDGTYRSAAA